MTANDLKADPPPGRDRAAILSARDLRVTFDADHGSIEAVRGVDIALGEGEILGIVGESGSGKSVSCQAMLGLLPGNARISGALTLDGRDIDPSDKKALAGRRGRTLSMIFQDPMSALDPLMTVGGHLRQRLLRHGKNQDHAEQLLSRAGVQDTARVSRSYAHQLSGGLCQRVTIALALAGAPRVLVADEPTTALDVTIQAQVLNLLAELRVEEALSVILVSHDLGVVAQICDRIAVMYAGQIVETGPVTDVLSRPLHPYTKALIFARPTLDGPLSELRPIPGTAPTPLTTVRGCAFAPRCASAASVCATPPPLNPGTTSVRCHFSGESLA